MIKQETVGSMHILYDDKLHRTRIALDKFPHDFDGPANERFCEYIEVVLKAAYPYHLWKRVGDPVFPYWLGYSKVTRSFSLLVTYGQQWEENLGDISELRIAPARLANEHVWSSAYLVFADKFGPQDRERRINKTFDNWDRETGLEYEETQPCRMFEQRLQSLADIGMLGARCSGARLDPRSRPRRFALLRDEDESGVSGMGHVAEGIQFTDGSCVMRWRTPTRSTGVYDSAEKLLEIHGHGGKTRIEWID